MSEFVIYGYGVPYATPEKIGVNYHDVLTRRIYIAVGTNTPGDWLLVNKSVVDTINGKSGNISLPMPEVGDVRLTLAAPGDNWVPQGSTQLQAAYPELFALVGLINAAPASLSNFAPVVIDSGDTDHYCIATDNAGVWIMGGAAAGTGYVLRSADNGDTWTPVSTTASTVIRELTTDKAGNWLAVSDTENTLYRSVDNGATWAAVTTQAVAAYDVELAPNGVAIAVGYQGKMQRSTDFGVTWTLITSGFSSTKINRIRHDGAGNWVALGWYGKTSYSSDDGASFTLTAGTPMGTANMSQLETDGAGNWLASGSNQTYKSTNNGVNWTRYEDISFDSMAYVSGSEWVGVNTDKVVKRSFDGGQTWSTHSTLATRVYGIALATDGKVFAAPSWGKEVMVPAESYPYNPATQFQVPEVTATTGSTAYVRAAA